MEVILIDTRAELKEAIKNTYNLSDVQIRCNYINRPKVVGSKNVYERHQDSWVKKEYDELGYQLSWIDDKNNWGHTLHHDGNLVYRQNSNKITLWEFRKKKVDKYIYSKNLDRWTYNGNKIKKSYVENKCSRVLNLIKSSYHSSDLEKIEQTLKWW